MNPEQLTNKLFELMEPYAYPDDGRQAMGPVSGVLEGSNMNSFKEGTSRRSFLKSVSRGTAALIVGSEIGCTIPFLPMPKEERAPKVTLAIPTEYAPGQKVGLRILLTSRGDVTVTHQVEGMILPREKRVVVHRNLEVVNQTEIDPIVVPSVLRQIAAECSLESTPMPVLLLLTDTPLPATRPGPFKEDIGVTAAFPEVNRVVSIVSLKGVLDEVERRRAREGQSLRERERARIAADMIYLLTEYIGHELFHAGRHILLGDQVLLQRYNELEEEARSYSRGLANRVQFKEIPPVAVITKLPSSVR